MALTIMATSALAARLAQPLGVKPLLLTGLAALMGAALLLSRVSVGGSYLGDVLPGMTLFAIGLAFSYTTATIGGTAMNSQSAQAAPAMLWEGRLEGPTATRLRMPLVGKPPLIQALAAGVA